MKKLAHVFMMVSMLLAALAGAQALAAAEEIQATCVAVSLENHCIVRTKDRQLLQVQLWGVEKPGDDAALRAKAKAHLSGLILNKPLRLEVVNREGDSCQAMLHAGDSCVNSTMLWCGFLKVNAAQAGENELLTHAEADARKAASGCWYQKGAVPASVADMTSGPWDVKVNSVVDGDTLTASGEDGRETHVCLHGCDAPEEGQAGEREACEALAAELEGKVVRLILVGEDERHIKTARVYADGVYVNLRMLRRGYGQVPPSCEDADLKRAEAEARSGKTGLWQKAEQESPWAYRQSKEEALKRQKEEEALKRQKEEEAKKAAAAATTVGGSSLYGTSSRIPRYTPSAKWSTGGSSYRKSSGSSSYTPSSGGSIHVKGYYRKDGTYVRPHTRRRR